MLKLEPASVISMLYDVATLAIIKKIYIYGRTRGAAHLSHLMKLGLEDGIYIGGATCLIDCGFQD